MTCCRKVVPVFGSPMCMTTLGRAGGPGTGSGGAAGSATASPVNRTTSRLVGEGARQRRLAGVGESSQLRIILAAARQAPVNQHDLMVFLQTSSALQTFDPPGLPKARAREAHRLFWSPDPVATRISPGWKANSAYARAFFAAGLGV